MVEQVKARRIGLMEVLDDEADGAALREQLDRSLDRLEEPQPILLRRSAGWREGEKRIALGRKPKGATMVRPGIGERRVRHARFAIEANTDQRRDRRLLFAEAHALARKSRLAETGLPDDEEHAGLLVEEALHRSELARAAKHRARRL